MSQVVQRVSVIGKPNGIATFLNIDFNLVIMPVKKWSGNHAA
jgi:hypothetical protein